MNVAAPDVADKAVRWSRLLRPFLVVNFPEGRQVGRISFANMSILSFDYSLVFRRRTFLLLRIET